MDKNTDKTRQIEFDLLKAKQMSEFHVHGASNLNEIPRKEQVLVNFILGLFSVGAMASTEAPRTYQGTDKGRPCFLYIHSETSEGSKYQVEVSTSYEHEGQGVGKVLLQFLTDSSGKILEWQNNETKEFLRVLLRNPSKTLENPAAFRLKWMHFDHLHDSTCSELQRLGME